MPQLRMVRPADANETAHAWRVAVDGDGPTHTGDPGFYALIAGASHPTPSHRRHALRVNPSVLPDERAIRLLIDPEGIIPSLLRAATPGATPAVRTIVISTEAKIADVMTPLMFAPSA